MYVCTHARACLHECDKEFLIVPLVWAPQGKIFKISKCQLVEYVVFCVMLLQIQKVFETHFIVFFKTFNCGALPYYYWPSTKLCSNRPLFQSSGG